MYVCTDDFGNAACQEVPDDNTAVVAAHRQEGPPAVEGAGEGHADAVKRSICLLTKANKRGAKLRLQLHTFFQECCNRCVCFTSG